MVRKRRKPHDPAEDMRLRLEQAAARAERDRLRATGADAVVVTQVDEETGIKHWVASGSRKDAFAMLLDRRALDRDAFDAIRRYEEALDTAMGHNTPERRPDHIRASVEGAPGQNISQAQVNASRMVRWVEDRLSPSDRRLLTALRLNPSGQWHAVVRLITGEINDDCHAPRVRAMADNVRHAVSAYFREQRRAA